MAREWGALCFLRDEKGSLLKALGPRERNTHPFTWGFPLSHKLMSPSPLLSPARPLGEASRCSLNWKEQRNNEAGRRRRRRRM